MRGEHMRGQQPQCFFPLALRDSKDHQYLCGCDFPLRPCTPCAPCPQPSRLVVAFVIGGTTYEEAKAVAELNAAGERGEGWSAGLRLVLGGTGVQNSAGFLKDFQEVMLNERYHS